MSEQDTSASTGFPSGRDETDLGKAVVKHRLATSKEVRECMTLQRKDKQEGRQQRPLSELLVSQGYVTENQLKRLTCDDERPGTKKQQFPGYQLLDKLGKGAMATVYKARQLSLDRIVALKVLPKRYSENPEFVDRFYREGKAAAKLNHRNIVQAIDVSEAGGNHYFVMEYVDGYTVHDVLARNKRYSEQEALDIVIQITDALAHAHEKGLVHRDVKPKNIMITNEGVAKLADMGLAREVSDTRLARSEAGRAFGTPYYISPEQIRGELDIDFRADIYALGATFYHMVTGKVPYDASNPTGVMLKHLRENITPPDHINPSLSVGCAEIIEVMLHKDRKERYQSTRDLLEDLQSVKEGKPAIHAKSIFDVSALANLEDEALPDYQETEGDSAQLATWKVISVVLAILLFLSIAVNIVLFVD